MMGLITVRLQNYRTIESSLIHRLKNELSKVLETGEVNKNLVQTGSRVATCPTRQERSLAKEISSSGFANSLTDYYKIFIVYAADVILGLDILLVYQRQNRDGTGDERGNQPDHRDLEPNRPPRDKVGLPGMERVFDPKVTGHTDDTHVIDR